jgi:hypothetical protein
MRFNSRHIPYRKFLSANVLPYRPVFSIVMNPGPAK